MSTFQESSTSGEITSSFENISDVFTSYSEIPSEGFNCLYKAQRYGKWFVLKGLKPEYRGQAIYVELLTKEFELGMKMDHPHVAYTFAKEIDPVAGPCIVMEYVDGVTLREFLATKPSAKLRRKVVTELLEAMAYYHSLQIIHRDFKPDNILITRNGNNVKIIDFGLADSDYHGILKQPAGSNKYAAPEQVAGNVPLDLRADLYAFGIVLGQIFPHRYNGIFSKCTRQNRDQRFSSAGEILQRLQRRRVLVPVLVATVMFLLIASLAALLWSRTALLQNNALNTRAATCDTIVQATELPVIVHDTIVISDDAVLKEAFQFIDAKMDSVFAPSWKWFRNATDNGAAIDSAKAYAILEESIRQTPSFHRKRHMTGIADAAVKSYPQCSEKRDQLEQYALQSWDKHSLNFSQTVVEFWEAKKETRKE